MTKYFTPDELKCKGTGVVRLANGFEEWINSIREVWGKPLTVNSCCRSLDYNKKIKGAKDSYHIYNHPDRSYGTCAIDLDIKGGIERREFIKMLFNHFPDASIGVNKAFIHVDRRAYYDKTDPLLFTY